MVTDYRELKGFSRAYKGLQGLTGNYPRGNDGNKE